MYMILYNAMYIQNNLKEKSIYIYDKCKLFITVLFEDDYPCGS